MNIDSSLSSHLRNLRAGETRAIPLDAGDIVSQSTWRRAFVTGLVSARLQRNAFGEQDHVVVRMAAKRPPPPRLPAPICGFCRHGDVVESMRLPEMTVGVCPYCHSGMVMEIEASSSGKGAPDDYSARYADEVQDDKVRSCWRVIRERTDGFQGIESILDIGCGSGAFLDLAKENGLITAGVEIAPIAALAALQKGHEIYCNSVESDVFPPGHRFDLIVMWDILEHLRNPHFALSAVVELLAPDGRLFILTPTMGSIFDRWGLKLAKLFGARLAQLVRMCWSEDHLFRFHPGGVDLVMRSLGFTRVKVTKVLLLSLKADRYAGGRILRSWTGRPSLDRLISRLGVMLTRALRISNKILIEARAIG